MIDSQYFERDLIYSNKSLDLCDGEFSYHQIECKPGDDDLDKYFDISLNNKQIDGENESENIFSERMWLMKLQDQFKGDFMNSVQELQLIYPFSLNNDAPKLTEMMKESQLQQIKTSIKKQIVHIPQTVSRFYNKNICRYIENHALRTLVTEIHREDVIKICIYHKINYQEFRDYYIHNKCKMQGVQLLKTHLKLLPSDSSVDVKRKKAFQSYLVWYLDNLATRHIITRLNKSDVRQYLQYKNYVMTYFIRCPDVVHVGNELPDWVKKN